MKEILGQKSIKEVEIKIKGSFKKVKQELEDHLDAINENTNEVQSIYETTCDIESKIDKLNQRIDKIELMLRNFFIKEEKIVYKVNPLEALEKNVFLSLYLQEEEKGTVTYDDLAKDCHVGEDKIIEIIESIMKKGIPITKKYINNVAYLKMDSDFKKQQAKENIIRLER